MKKDTKGFFVELMAIVGFILLSLSFFLVVSFFDESEDKVLQNLKDRKEGLYIDNYKKIGKYKVGTIQIPSIGLESVPKYFALCQIDTEFCYPIHAIRVSGNSIYLYYKEGFQDRVENTFAIFTQESEKFYSLDDLKNLPQEESKILLELKEKPRFILE